MAEPHRIYGMEVSPYSVKVRSYFRYKGIPHRWIVRNSRTQTEYAKHAKIPIIPLVLTPDDEVLQDSTPILETLEARFPDPSLHPDDRIAAFVSLLLEEFGDEWGNKWMFHLRWARDVDRESAAGRIAGIMLPGAKEEQRLGTAAQVRQRMTGRMGFVGSSPENGPAIELSFRDSLRVLETHLAHRPYLMGGRPAYADFGLFPQIYEAWTDPTAGSLIEGETPQVLDWIHRMLWPRAEGGFEPWKDLETTLAPLIERQVAGWFLPWTLANAAAVQAEQAEFEVALGDHVWRQAPQKYHAKSLRALREKYARAADGATLDAFLERTGCLAALRA